ncbi:MAG: DNA polymerase III subunit gamma/tau [Fusobacterium perfoetens]|uniref:DNA polymerase III subunit gamma/tau n=1 Tax=Fusobacterium perfoetens TaxID=852 RepID=UPI0023F4ADCA|nr:DNA polymerase III subunit gamma/tau [Fusobacterium perfoetens]MCI6152401.1 DNA polymerase III subunit gamma/tau [Fusobacterium perfoetens]MDY3237000.1 DNA polymerase III subunit gamma/tau [Fusobacterium perfoetens]
MHVTLYRKYRPKTFEEVAGESDIIKTLKNSLDNNKLSHAYLFSGPRGVGKTTSARLIAKGVNCLNNGISSTPCNHCENCQEIDKGSFIDLIEIDAASNRGIDEIRELKDKINYRPSKGRKKIYIIDEVHMLTKEAFNALLKTLEEPPEHVIFILATTEPDKILPTIISRCQRYDFKTLSYKEVSEKLSDICEKENIKIDNGSLELIYEASGGSMRDSISILERVIIANLNQDIIESKTSEILGVTSKETLREFYDIIKSKSLKNGVEFLEKLWIDSIDIEKYFKDFAKYIKDEVISQRISVEEGLKIIGGVYDSLNKFKYEEDKRLLGHVVLNNIIKLSEKSKETEIVYKEVVISPKENINENSKSEKEVLISIDEVKNKWNDILKAAKDEKPTYKAFLSDAFPLKIEDNTLYIAFRENEFSKESMESDYYNLPFQEIVQQITKSKLKTAYIFKKEIKEKSKDNMTKNLVSYLEGLN